MIARVIPAAGPVRGLAVVTLVNTTGNGIYFTLSALYFTRVLGFSVVSVGIGLSIAAIGGLVAGVPIGHLADRHGPREVLVLMLLCCAAANALLLAVSSYWQFVLVAALFVFFEGGANAARNAMIGGVVSGTGRASTRAYLRSITNVGMTFGTGIAAIALHFDTRTAYVAILYLDVLSYLICAVLTARLPHIATIAAVIGRSMFAAARDLPFVAVTLVHAVLGMHYWIIEIAMPLWIVGHTDAPRWLISVLVVINTGVVVVGQVAVARRVDSVRMAVAAAVLSGALFLVACGLFGISGSTGAQLSIVVLIAAGLAHVLGEMNQAASAFLLSFELAPVTAVGQYQGLFSTGQSVTAFAAPAVMALLPLQLGALGWWLLGLLLFVTSLALGPTVAWASRTREQYGVTAEAPSL